MTGYVTEPKKQNCVCGAIRRPTWIDCKGALHARQNLAGIGKDPSESPHTSDCVVEAVSGASTCDTCGQPVTPQDFPEGSPWKWYECESCGECATIECFSGLAASESNPTAPFCGPEGETATIDALSAPVEDPSPGEGLFPVDAWETPAAPTRQRKRSGEASWR